MSKTARAARQTRSRRYGACCAAGPAACPRCARADTAEHRHGNQVEDADPDEEHARHQRAIQRLRREQRDEGHGEKPWQRPDTAGNAHLVAQRPQHVIARQQREEIRKGPQRRRQFRWGRRHGAPQPVLKSDHGGNDSYCLNSAALTDWPQPGPPCWKRLASASLPTTTGLKPAIAHQCGDQHGRSIVAGDRDRQLGAWRFASRARIR